MKDQKTTKQTPVWGPASTVVCGNPKAYKATHASAALHAEQAVSGQPKLDKQLRELAEPDCRSEVIGCTPYKIEYLTLVPRRT